MKPAALGACTISLWLAALSPMPPKVKGFFYIVALGGGMQLIHESKKLIVAQAQAQALKLITEELEDTEYALHTLKQKRQLEERYAPEQTYSEEVHEDLIENLEHLYSEEPAEHPAETSANTSTSKALYLSICKLLEVTNKTFVIEEILQRGGRSWKEGEARLQEILDEGKANGW